MVAVIFYKISSINRNILLEFRYAMRYNSKRKRNTHNTPRRTLKMTQKELKKMYADILTSEVWHDDQHMVDFCVKEAAYIVELTNGDIVVIEKPRIKKDFCFGYSDSRYDTEDMDRAYDMAHHASTSEDYFISENLADIDEKIAYLERKELSSLDFYLCTNYYRQPENSKLKSLNAYYWHDERKKGTVLDGEDRDRVIEGYKKVRESFEKRLHAYLKRYGMSQVRSWAYWQDE